MKEIIDQLVEAFTPYSIIGCLIIAGIAIIVFILCLINRNKVKF